MASASLSLPVQVASAGLGLPLSETRSVPVVPAMAASVMPPMQSFGDAAPLPEPALVQVAATVQVAAAAPMQTLETAPAPTASASPVPPAESTYQLASASPLLSEAPHVQAPAQAAGVNPVPAEEPEHVASINPAPSAKPLPSLGALMRVASVNPNDPLPEAKPSPRVAEIPNECLVAQICIDEYLWAMYQRAPKLDTAKILEKVKVQVKRKGKLRTVTKTVPKYVPQDFTWKDPIAAERAKMSLMDYVIGGMDRRYRTKLYHALRMMDAAGLEPGITSAFRDDYRQAIATGNKASSDSSFHGGSRRGGYGHGMAIDIVSVKGDTRMQRFASSEILWKWIDEHEKELGVGRPYLDRDPPHIAPGTARNGPPSAAGRRRGARSCKRSSAPPPWARASASRPPRAATPARPSRPRSSRARRNASAQIRPRRSTSVPVRAT